MHRFARRTLVVVALLPLIAAAQVKSQPGTSAASIEGTWAGVLEVGGVPLHIVFHLRKTAVGLTGTMDSPDQGAKGIPMTSVTLAGPTLTIEAGTIRGAFHGTVSEDHDEISGSWQQGGQSFPLVLKPVRDEAALAPKRPQTPLPPFPYRSEDVSYPNPQSGNTLAGALTIPAGGGPFPAVLLISGSGPHDRDETIFGHKPFLVLADFLTRHGIEVLRADKRGVGKSTGNAAATLTDYASDAEAGVAFLRTRKQVDPRRIGLLGHSEGGIVAPMVAAEEPGEIGFLVLLAGPGVPGLDIVVAQTRLIAEASGVPAATAEKNAEEERRILDLVVSEPNSSGLEEKLREELAKDGVAEGRIQGSIQVLTSPSYRDFLSFDPATALRRVRCPVLALAGSKDTQVPAAENLVAIRGALEKGGNHHIETAELPGLNHLFQPATTGAPSEYAQIEETMAPAVLDEIARWILQQQPLATARP
ncbi:MAG TPA: alpha/beta hydrolase [Acidobacteriaceae bacterium]|nr:alpha/beta hydrolase [Acidobacteriaceae bacterium]